MAARIERWKGNYAKAESHLSVCKELQGITDKIQLEWVLLRAFGPEFLDLEAPLKNCVEKNHPETNEILHSLAFCYLKEYRFWSALEVLDNWLERSPKSAPAFFLRGLLFERLGNRDKALPDYQRAVELAPNRWEIQVIFVQFLLSEKKIQEAANLLEKVIKNHGHEPEVSLALGMCRLHQGKLEEAEKLLLQVIQVNPKIALAFYHLGQLDLQRGKFRQAEEWFRKALAEEPSLLNARYALYQSLQQQPDKKEKALEVLGNYKEKGAKNQRIKKILEGIEQRPENPDLLAEAGEFFLLNGQETLGRHFLFKTLQIHGGHKKAHQILAKHYLEKKQPEEAEFHFKMLSVDLP